MGMVDAGGLVVVAGVGMDVGTVDATGTDGCDECDGG